MASKGPEKPVPKDGQAIEGILKDMGITEYDPRVINQLLEFTYRYVSDVLEDAKLYSGHASKKEIDVDDVRLAIQCKVDTSFTSPPPRELLVDLAKTRNSQPLPQVKPFAGLRLPPDRYCLTGQNYRLKSAPRESNGQDVLVSQGGLPAHVRVVSSGRPAQPQVATQRVITQHSVLTAASAIGVKRKHDDDDYD